jgi:fluoroquinolone transport system permease protein
MRCDVRLQLRNGFYLAVGFLLAILAAVISQLPDFAWEPIVAPLILGNLSLATFMFMAGLVLLEKDEGTLEAQVVTPLRSGEYLVSKTATLTGLSVAENVVVAILVCGLGLRLGPLVVGIVLAAALYCLAGFIAVARYDSINEFLFPSMLYIAAFSLPILHYAGLWETPLMYLHPLQAPLVVLGGAVVPLTAWQWLYGVGYSALWIGLGFAWSRRAFLKFVVARAGAR